jgi:hypothetical protein
MESNNNPQRKIIFSAPGKQFATSDAIVTDKTQTSIPFIRASMIEAVDKTPAFRSFAHDIKSNVTENGVSMAQIVMGEERRRQEAGATTEDIFVAGEKSKILKVVLMIIGFISIVGGGIALFFTFRAATPVAVISEGKISVIRAQKSTEIELRDGYKNTLIEAVRGVSATRIPEETFVEIKVLDVDFGRFMEILESGIPPELIRSVGSEYSLGLYGGTDSNVPFFIFNTDTFDNAYAGMKLWEISMTNDIGGIFMNTQTLSVIVASSSASLFRDKVYYNKDTRVVFGRDGNPVLLWAILDGTRIIMTRDGETLNAIMRRLTLENITR